MPIRYFYEFFSIHSSINPEWNPNIVAYYPLDEPYLIHYDLSRNRLDFEYQNNYPIIDNSPLASPAKGLSDPFDIVVKMETNGIPIPCRSEIFNTNAGFTIEFWFYLENNVQDDYPFVGITNRPLHEGFAITYKKSLNKLWCHILEPSDVNPLLYLAFTPVMKKWHHVSCAESNLGSGWSQLTIDDNLVVTKTYIPYVYTGIFTPKS